jgi:hypothetical protein
MACIERLVNEHIGGHAACKERKFGKMNDRLDEQIDYSDMLKEDIEKVTEKVGAIEKRLGVLEGEAPEVVDGKSCVENLMEGIRILHGLEPEPCHRNPKRNCALRNIVNRMDCAICEEVAARVSDSMRKER